MTTKLSFRLGVGEKSSKRFGFVVELEDVFEEDVVVEEDVDANVDVPDEDIDGKDESKLYPDKSQ